MLAAAVVTLTLSLLQLVVLALLTLASLGIAGAIGFCEGQWRGFTAGRRFERGLEARRKERIRAELRELEITEVSEHV